MIVIEKSTPPELFSIIETVCSNLTERFDVSSEIISTWLSNEHFSKYSKSSFEENRKNILEAFMDDESEMKQLLSLYKMEKPLELISNMVGWDREKCGHLIQRYENGYQKYCNLLKQEHDELETDHPFKYKTYQQMIDERVFDLKVASQQTCRNNILIELHSYLERYLNEHYKVIRTLLFGDTSEKTDRILEWLKKHPKCFKSKIGINIGERKYLDIYTPKEFVKEYYTQLKEIQPETFILSSPEV